VGWTLSSHNLLTDRLRKLFQPSKEAESLLAWISKMPEIFGFEHIFGVTYGLRGVLRNFWMTSSEPDKRV